MNKVYPDSLLFLKNLELAKKKIIQELPVAIKAQDGTWSISEVLSFKSLSFDIEQSAPLLLADRRHPCGYYCV